MKTVYCITARLKSTRLPRKALIDVAGRPILAHQLDRLKHARRVDEIVIATSTNSEDDPLEALAASEGVACYRGDKNDVLVRLHEAASTHRADYLLNITGDCPFVDPVYADRIVEAFEQNGADLIRAFDLPHGAFSYGIKPSALARVVQIKDDTHTEAWGRYFTDTGLFDVVDLPVDPRHRRPGLRMTLDYPEDLRFVEAVFAGLFQSGRVFSLDEILAFLDAHPEVVAMNRHCGDLYKQRFAAQSTIRLKPRQDVARAALLGCGAIGQRHARNLRALGIGEIVALRTRLGSTRDLDSALGVREVATLRELIDARPDVAIVSNPTSRHVESAMAIAPHVKGLFIEKPVAESLAAGANLERALAGRSVVTFVGYNLQFHPAIERLAALQPTLGRALVFQCAVGQWLPDWHPAEDYRRAYFARSDLGGGMIRTLSHELHLAGELLGPARAVHCVVSPYPELGVDVDVVADLQIQHESGATSQIHLDAVQRVLQRQGLLAGEHGWARYDLVTPSLVAQKLREPAPQVVWQDDGYDVNDGYARELERFLQYVREGRQRHEHDLHRGLATMALIDAALASARSGRPVPVSEAAALR